MTRLAFLCDPNINGKVWCSVVTALLMLMCESLLHRVKWSFLRRIMSIRSATISSTLLVVRCVATSCLLVTSSASCEHNHTILYPIHGHCNSPTIILLTLVHINGTLCHNSYPRLTAPCIELRVWLRLGWWPWFWAFSISVSWSELKVGSRFPSSGGTESSEIWKLWVSIIFSVYQACSCIIMWGGVYLQDGCDLVCRSKPRRIIEYVSHVTTEHWLSVNQSPPPPPLLFRRSQRLEQRQTRRTRKMIISSPCDLGHTHQHNMHRSHVTMFYDVHYLHCTSQLM